MSESERIVNLIFLKLHMTVLVVALVWGVGNFLALKSLEYGSLKEYVYRLTYPMNRTAQARDKAKAEAEESARLAWNREHPPKPSAGGSVTIRVGRPGWN
jgi:hypothetical protein